MSDPGFIEQKLARLAGKLLVTVARRAAKRKDFHTLNHLLAGVTAINTGKDRLCRTCRDKGFLYDHNQHEAHEYCAFTELTGGQIRVLVASLKAGQFNTYAEGQIP